VEWLCAGLLEAALPAGAFELVSAQYPALRRTADDDAERTLLAAVAPGCALLLDAEERVPAQRRDHVPPFDSAPGGCPAHLRQRLVRALAVAPDGTQIVTVGDRRMPIARGSPR